MKYESEILYDLMKRDGLLNPSQDNLPYESELKEEYIDGVKGAYPKLTDYQAEWLNYAYNEQPIGEFPYVALSDVTNASIENVVPYAYKSAILKGDSQRVFSPTKNLFDGELEQGTIDYTNGKNGDLSTAIRSKNFVEIGTNTTFTLSRKKGTATLGFRCYNKNKDYLGTKFTAVKDGTLKTTYTTDAETVYIKFIDNTNDLNNQYQIEIGSKASDYEEPNYELKSVQMPVLTTTGKNLFDGHLELGNIEASNGTNVNSSTRKRSVNYIPVNGNTTYYVSNDKACEVAIRAYDKNKNYINSLGVATTFTPPAACKFIRIVVVTVEEVKVQVEQGSIATSYEPYKSNILTVNEDVRLRSNGNVYDELDLLTGKLTQRIDENGEVLSQEIVKTVDLTITNQNGESLSKMTPIEGTMHLTTSSDTIAPTFSGEIPVEAIEQNLSSFVHLEGVEENE